MIIFHVTENIYNDITKFEKRHEYREYKPYWIKCFTNVNPPLIARIYKAYTNVFVDITIIKVRIIETKDIINTYYRSFIKTKDCYDIEFKLE